MFLNTILVMAKPSNPSVKLIDGKTTALGVPVSREVRAYSRVSGALLGKTHSAEDGAYKLYLPFEEEYTLVAIDEYDQYNAVIQDRVK
jgi:hypothetical protein